MTAFRSADSLDGDRPARCRYMSDFTGARLYVYARSFGTVLQIDGEIDSSNAMSVAEVIRRFARLKTPLILDLSHLDFLSIDGFRALLVLNNEHQQARVHCSWSPATPCSRYCTSSTPTVCRLSDRWPKPFSSSRTSSWRSVSSGQRCSDIGSLGTKPRALPPSRPDAVKV